MQQALRGAWQRAALEGDLAESGAHPIVAADDDLAFAATHDGTDDDVTWFVRTSEHPIAREAASARPPVSTRRHALALAATTAAFAIAGKVAVLCLLATHLV